MYLLYADESGELTDPTASVFVVGGIAAHEDAVRPLAGEINATMKRFVGEKFAAKAELHGNPMRSGSKEWHTISAAKRHGLVDQLLKHVCEWTHDPTQSQIQPFVVVVDRDYSQSPLETAYAELLWLFDMFLRQGRKEGDPHNGVLVADRSKYEKTLHAWVAHARGSGGRRRRLYALAETPFFVDSQTTRLMQLADLVAYAAYRAYNADDWRWAATLMPGLLDPPRLMHFTNDQACGCPACRVGRGETA